MRLLPRIVLFCAASGTVVTAVPVATQGDSNGRVRKANDQKWPPELVLGLLGTAVFGPPLVAKGVRMWRNRGQRGNDRQTVQQAEVQQAETQRATAQRAVSQIEAADPAAVQRLEALVRHELTIWDDEKLSSNCFQTMMIMRRQLEIMKLRRLRELTQEEERIAQITEDGAQEMCRGRDQAINNVMLYRQHNREFHRLIEQAGLGVTGEPYEDISDQFSEMVTDAGRSLQSTTTSPAMWSSLGTRIARSSAWKTIPKVAVVP